MEWQVGLTEDNGCLNMIKVYLMYVCVCLSETHHFK